MKKMYFLAFLAFSFASTVSAQIYFENFEGFNLGDISSQSPHWRTWSGAEGGPEDADVVSGGQEGARSLMIDGSQITDQLLLIPGNPTSGSVNVGFYLAIHPGKGFYFNMQAALTPGSDPWQQAIMGGNVYFNCDGNSDGIGIVTSTVDCSAPEQTFSYPVDTYFRVTLYYDLDNETWSMRINSNLVFENQPFEFGGQNFESLAAIDFYSATPHNEGFIDVVEINQTLGTEDFDQDTFFIYPNPVKDVLTVQSKEMVDSVEIFDLLGKLVLSQKPNSISPSVNISSLAPGSYLAKVTIGDASKTLKIIKQ
ncbi:T9SS type A sorting domain-containing protein [Aequorivita todarodis]|uniref:T9SS type A sorting domain-containing protein n=1 Tax=Aequorivita todarodis TaxID=2036821 RepID=UPI00235054FF|nr:T9SS type A sorting domain-containing protein [Aequorivita todarodis]MDC8000617.1 T9SS type A sorting domain-containing protein [Aequorivita todarodis]